MNFSSIPISSTKLNFYLAQRNRSQDTLTKSAISSRSKPKSPIKQLGNLVHYPNDSLDQMSLQSQRFNYKQNSSILKNNTVPISMTENLSNSYPLSTSRAVQYYSYEGAQQNLTSRKHINWKAQPPKIKKTNVFLQNIDQTMKQISNNLCSITYQLSMNTKNLQKLYKMNEQYERRNRPTHKQILKRVNFKFAQVNLQRDKELERKKPRLVYEDKVYKDPKYIIWNPRH